MYKKLPLLTVLFLLVFTGKIQSSEQKLQFEDMWVRLTPPVAVNTAGYFKLTNTSDSAIVITSAKSDVSKKSELHDMKMENGGMSMVHIPRLTIASGETVEFKPGGKHLMLLGLHSPLKKDLVITVTFVLEDGTSQSVKFPVMKNMDKGKMHKHH